ncbi:MAG: MCE family protein, partial [Acetobacteraceae bacterium]|nr:MCE family protein [Acetobacteraceae bacterium]
MRRSGTFLRVGVLMLVGTAALLGLVLFLSGQRLSEGIPFESYFRESVQGLEVGAPVKYRGVTIGRVTNIGLVSAEYGRNEPLEIQRSTYQLVFVRYTINPDRVGRVPDTETAIRTGLRARLAS